MELMQKSDHEIDLSTTYMGLKLKNPLVASASPLSRSYDGICQLEDAGIGAIVLFSLFEEQIIHDEIQIQEHMTRGTESYAEALSYYPQNMNFAIGPDEYIRHLQKAKKRVKVPVIASLNGSTSGGWIKYAKYMQEAGADALELNIYFIPTDVNMTGPEVEQRYIDILKSVKSSVTIPVAVKVSPFFSNMAHMAKRFDEAGADALVLFNRFYQPDIDLENLEVMPNLLLSTPQAMRLPLRWTAILYGRLKCNIGVTSGVHGSADVLKMLMAGADATMLCSSLLKNGIPHVTHILSDMQNWMFDHEYKSVSQMKGSMSQKSSPNPEMFERANYLNMLESYARKVRIKSIKD